MPRPRKASRASALPLQDGEWIETNGLGGYACMPVQGPRRRRYHALLTIAEQAPVRRKALLKDLLLFVQTDTGTWPLNTAHFADGTDAPASAAKLVRCAREPWPCWKVEIPDGTQMELELFLPHGRDAMVLSVRRTRGAGAAWLHARPLVSGCGHHQLRRADAEGPALHSEARGFTAQPGGTPFALHASAAWSAEPHWWLQFHLSEEAARGFDSVEDLWQPGVFSTELKREPVCFVARGGAEAEGLGSDPLAEVAGWRRSERRRRAALAGPHALAADQFLVRRGAAGLTLIAGYPWFTDYGRDTFIALRGLLHATGRWDAAQRVLLTWAALVDENGALPNAFAEDDNAALFNSADAPLWFAVAVAEHLKRRKTKETTTLRAAALRVLTSVIAQRHPLLKPDGDGLLMQGTATTQLTWMDAQVDGAAVTPRCGKAVEIQALWLNALALLKPRGGATLLRRGMKSFRTRFVMPGRTYLRDVVDSPALQGGDDETLRPNQVLALGGLPLSLIPRAQARAMLEHVEMALWTPRGLRTLDPGDARYRAQLCGDAAARDSAYHQGTVWPWLAGPFIEAWVAARGGTRAARKAARVRFLRPFMAHAGDPGLGHLCEIADGDAPHAARGAPFQAWSLGELLRLELEVLA